MMNNAKVLISGGTGLIGSALTELLCSRGFKVVHLSRTENMSGVVKAFRWNIHNNFIDDRAFDGVTHIVHLAGEGIGDGRWTASRKKEIIDSRTKSADMLYSAVKRTGISIEAFVGASAVGYYGAVTTDQLFVETDPPASDFLGTCCRLWEDTYAPFEESGIRIVKIRTATVLSDKGGALPKLVAPVKMGFGAPLGTGRQFVPWIHIDDLREVYFKALTDGNMQGAFNTSTDDHVTNEELTIAIARRLNKKILKFNVPAFVLKMWFGDMSAIVLEGSRVDNARLLNSGFQFKYPKIDEALKTFSF